MCDAPVIHDSAFVDDGAFVGSGTRIWHFCHVMPGARIGNDCVLGQNAFVAATVSIGDGVKIQNNVSLYDGVILEDYVFCGPSVVFTNVITPRANVSRKDEYVETLVRRGASLGANATILCGVEIGEYALVGAGAVVTRDVTPHSIVTGVPARQTGWACRCGSVLTIEQDQAECDRCGLCYTTSEEGIAEIADGRPHT